jgi:DNA modification methylase
MKEPYYSDNMVTIYHGDSVRILEEMPPGAFSVLLSDPPYCSGGSTEAAKGQAKGQGLRSEILREVDWFRSDNIGTQGLCALLRTIAFESSRILPEGGTATFFCDWRMVSALQPAIESAGLRFRSLIAWDKGSPGLGSGFRSQHELILHFALGTPKYFSDSGRNVVRVKRKRWEAHPTEKPVELMAELLRVVAGEGSIVCDPFGGSGSTAVAARKANIKSILIEREEKYCEIAAKRVAQRSLFETPA